jgi:hypothetical protein
MSDKLTLMVSSSNTVLLNLRTSIIVASVHVCSLPRIAYFELCVVFFVLIRICNCVVTFALPCLYHFNIRQHLKVLICYFIQIIFQQEVLFI